MVDKYTECPECGHHRSLHKSRRVDRFYCGYGGTSDALGSKIRPGHCECTKSKEDIDAYVATFDTRTCDLCGLGNVSESNGRDWSHGDVHGCMRAMGKKVRELEREMFSRRSAIRDQKEKRNGKQ